MDEKKLSRRDVIRGTVATGAGLIAAANGLPVFAEDKPAPVDLPVGSSDKLTVIYRTEYLEVATNKVKETLEKFAAANNIALDASTTNPEAFGDFLGKMTAAVKAGNPPDFAYTSNVSVPQLHVLDLVEDVSDVVDEAVSKYGNIMQGTNADKIAKIDGKWWAVPLIANTTGTFFRGEKLKEKGIDPASLKTWGDRREAALAISDPANEFWGWGVTVNQSGDGWGIASGILNAFGGHFTDETGMIVQFNTPEAVAAFEFVRETYDRNGKYAAMLPPGVESWGDTSNNEAWLAGKIGYTHNAFSVYAASHRDNVPFVNDIVLLRQPDANNGDSRDGGAIGGWLTVFKGAKNAELAKKLALYMLDPANFTPITEVAGGLFMPAYDKLWTEDLLTKDPNFRIIKAQVSVPEPFIGPSWPAKPSALIDQIRPQGILEQAMGNVIAGRMSSADAVKDAHDKIVQIFEEGGAPQP